MPKATPPLGPGGAPPMAGAGPMSFRRVPMRGARSRYVDTLNPKSGGEKPRPNSVASMPTTMHGSHSDKQPPKH